MDDRKARLLPEVIPHHRLRAGASVIVEELKSDGRDLLRPAAKNSVSQELERLRLSHTPKTQALLGKEGANVPADRFIAAKEFPERDHCRLGVQKIEKKRRSRARHAHDHKPLVVAAPQERAGAKGHAR